MSRTLSHVVAALTAVCFVVCGFSIGIGIHYPAESLWTWLAGLSAVGTGVGLCVLYDHGT